MCEAWPGPRCSHDMGKKVLIRLANLEAVKAKTGDGTSEYKIAAARLDYAQEEYDSTPKGISDLKEKVLVKPSDENIERLNKGLLTRQLQTNALKENNNGRFEAVAALSSDREIFLDNDESASVLEASREYYEKFALKNPNVPQEPVSQEVYDKFVNHLEATAQADYPDGIPANLQANLETLKGLTPPDKATFRTYEYYPRALEKAKLTLNREIRKAGFLQGVNNEVAQSYYEAYREQYKKDYASRTESERPDPPESWVRGELSQSGYTQDPSSAFAPRDKASLYAIYRLRSDEEATPDFLKNSRGIASIDLETSGPAGHDGFEPKNGRIIEVGIVSYSAKGKELSRLSQLVRPEQAFLDQHGTGWEGHGIKVADLEDSPSWDRVQRSVSKALEGKVLLAQNSTFEYRWLSHHLDGFNADKKISVVDPMDMSRKHLDLPNHQLKTICGAVGVPYSEGHRATHDAEAAGQAYFELKKYIKKTWNSKPARKKAAKLKILPLGSRWDAWAKPAK